VWFDILHPNGSEYVSAYAAKNGQIIAASCAPGAVTVRPIGNNAQYPPVITSGNPSGFHIEMDLGEEGRLEADVWSTLVIADVILYTRWIGTITGGVLGGTNYTGMALYEKFKLSAT